MKNQVGLIILLFHKLLLEKQVHIFPLRKELNNSMRGLITIQNGDNGYFR